MSLSFSWSHPVKNLWLHRLAEDSREALEKSLIPQHSNHTCFWLHPWWLWFADNLRKGICLQMIGVTGALYSLTTLGGPVYIPSYFCLGKPSTSKGSPWEHQGARLSSRSRPKLARHAPPACSLMNKRQHWSQGSTYFIGVSDNLFQKEEAHSHAVCPELPPCGERWTWLLLAVIRSPHILSLLLHR